MQSLIEGIIELSAWLWGVPILTLLTLSGIFFSIRLKFFQIRHLEYILRATLGQLFHKNTCEGEGTLSAFQALTSAVACTVGAGNIVGVPVAIAMGGPGAVFWMWVIALLGMSLKYSEIVLTIKYRTRNESGEYVGGPAYYMRRGLNMPWLAGIFALSLMFEVAVSSMTQANSLAASAKASMSIDPLISGLLVMFLAGVVVIGGVKRLGKITERLVPFMATLYIAASVIVVGIHYDKILSMLTLIFKSAFVPMSVAGGLAGSSIALAIRWGMARGLYSNEAGLGTAPIAHATAVTDHPARQGLWGVIEVFIDTILICTCTAFVVLSSGVWERSDLAMAGNTMATLAFMDVFGSWGGILVTICLMLFVFSTLIVLIWYGEKQAEYLFGKTAAIVYRWVCVLLIPLGAVGTATFLWQFLDLALALILFPNLIAILLLNREVVEIHRDFFESPGQYYLKETRPHS